MANTNTSISKLLVASPHRVAPFCHAELHRDSGLSNIKGLIVVRGKLGKIPARLFLPCKSVFEVIGQGKNRLNL